MARQPNANGMAARSRSEPLTPSRCGTSGDVTRENISVKHYMEHGCVPARSRDRPTEKELSASSTTPRRFDRTGRRDARHPAILSASMFEAHGGALL